MAAEFPAAVPTFTDPITSNRQNSPSHSTQHSKANDEITAIATLIGKNGENVVLASTLDTDGTLSADSDAKIATQKAVKTYADGLVIGAGGIPLGYLDTDGTLAANSDVKISSQKAVKTYVAARLAAIYPVGCIYTTTVSTNPNTLFGFGTWAAFGSGRVLVGLDAGQTEFDTVEETGGEKTHTLSEAEMPAHTHGDCSVSNICATGSAIRGPGAASDVASTSSTGSGQAHNNLQPYIVVYFFKRTA